MGGALVVLLEGLDPALRGRRHEAEMWDVLYGFGDPTVTSSIDDQDCATTNAARYRNCVVVDDFMASPLVEEFNQAFADLDAYAELDPGAPEAGEDTEWIDERWFTEGLSPSIFER